MPQNPFPKPRKLSELNRFIAIILGPEKSFYGLALIYGIGISLLSLATPISVQMLINTIAYTGLAAPLVVLSLTLFGLLLLSGLLNALRVHLMDVFGRRFYARMVSEIALRSIYALNPFFDDDSKGPLFNRYFDIVIVLKTLPNLLVGGFTIVLQAGVGFILVSMYHPLFLVFNLLVVLAICASWWIWGRRAIRSAMDLSHRKHAAAAWLEGLGASNGFYKSERHIEDALRKTDAVTNEYITRHRAHFRQHFSQTLSFLFIYAAASAALLGLGGWLVIQGQLSLGQLVAAELVLSVVFVGISQLGLYMTYYYDMCAAIEELSLFYDVEQEEPAGDFVPASGDASLEFVNARGDARGQNATLNMSIPAGARILARCDNHAIQRLFTNFMKRHDVPRGGYISLGGVDLKAFKVHALRQEIIVLDRPNAIEMTIREYLAMSTDRANPEAILAAVRTVGLDGTVTQLSDGLDTPIAATGWPLSISETLQLKLAAAILAQPRVLVLNQLYDVMVGGCLRRSLDLLQQNCGATVIFFSNRGTDLGYDTFLHLAADKQEMFASYAAFMADAATHCGDPATLPDLGGDDAQAVVAPEQ